MLFSAIADGLAFIMKCRGVHGLDHYLDDFSLVDPSQSPECQVRLDTALQVCEEVGFSVAPRKTEGPATQINLLGFIIDSNKMELRLPRKEIGESAGIGKSMEDKTH